MSENPPRQAGLVPSGSRHIATGAAGFMRRGLDLLDAIATKHDGPTEVQQLLRAAAQGDATAQYALGDRCANGQGVPQDDGQAAQWFRKAAEQGHAEAQTTLLRIPLCSMSPDFL